MQKLIRQLVEHFGQDKVKICTQYHVQVLTPKGSHNIWKSDGGFKLQTAGSRKIRSNQSTKSVLDHLSSYNYSTTEQAEMEEVHKLTSLMNHSATYKKDGIWVDAGWHNGSARIGIVLIKDNYIKAESFVIEAKTNIIAEEDAIIIALSKDSELIVYSDCQSVVAKLNNPRLKWIPREKNVSDAIGNKRRQT